MSKLLLIHGSCVEQKVDVIVNAANRLKEKAETYIESYKDMSENIINAQKEIEALWKSKEEE